jgi:hypothetical protein
MEIELKDQHIKNLLIEIERLQKQLRVYEDTFDRHHKIIYRLEKENEDLKNNSGK